MSLYTNHSGFFMHTDDTPQHKKRLFVVINPVAGFGDSNRARRRIISFCAQRGWTCELYETAEGEDLVAVVQAALQSGYDAIAAAGGDGTVSAVAAGLISSQVPLLILPVGTGNLLARDLGVPMDINRALELLEGGSAVQMLDAMNVNGEYHVLNVGVGWSSLIIKHTDRRDKRRLGILAYVITAARSLIGLQPHGFRLVVDDQKFRLRASEILIANGGLLGMPMSFEDVHVYPDDGRVDMFVIKARTLVDYLQLVYYILLRKPRKAPKMFYIQAAESIQIESDRPLPAQADGEFIGETPVSITVVPQAVKVFVPEKNRMDLVERLRNLMRVPVENMGLRPIRGTLRQLFELSSALYFGGAKPEQPDQSAESDRID